MDPLLATLAVLVLALGISGFGLARKLDRVRAELARLAKLEALEERVAALIAQLEKGELGARLEARLAELSESDLKLATAFADLRQRLPGPRAGRGAAAQPADAVRDHLLRLGFDDVHLLTDVETLPERSGRVIFEARRRGVLHKGYVEVADGRPQSESVQSAYGAFP